MKQKGKTFVLQKHIEKGIEKYNGQIAPDIQKHLDNIGWNYIVYLFQDNRILLVYEDQSFGILYDSKDLLFQDMEQEEQIKNNYTL